MEGNSKGADLETMVMGGVICKVCGGTGVDPPDYQGPYSHEHDCWKCFGMGSYLAVYDYYPWTDEKPKRIRKRVKVTEPKTEITYICHQGCLHAFGEICMCKCEGVNHGVIK